MKTNHSELQNRKIIQIVPRLPPATDGVGDYALNLARQLRQDHNIQTHFIVCDRAWSGENTIEGFPISQLSASTAKALSSLLSEKQAHTVLLHYVGYGYAKRGCPTWLVDGLKTWRNSSSQHKLVTMFHEVYASGAIWTSAFWLSQIQKRIATRLVQLSDRILTSKQFYADILSRLSDGKHQNITTLPVFSNIGEPTQVKLLSERKPWLVVFGGREKRRRVYKESHEQLNFVCQTLEIEKIIDIGSSTGLKLSNISNISIEELGKQPAEAVSQILLKSRLGFSNYSPNFLAKSTIFNAYRSHGLLPINAKGSDLEIDGIKSGRHYLVADTSIKNRGRFQAIADNSYAWYQNHRLSVQAQIFATNLQFSQSLSNHLL